MVGQHGRRSTPIRPRAREWRGSRRRRLRGSSRRGLAARAGSPGRTLALPVLAVRNQRIGGNCDGGDSGGRGGGRSGVSRRGPGGHAWAGRRRQARARDPLCNGGHLKCQPRDPIVDRVLAMGVAGAGRVRRAEQHREGCQQCIAAMRDNREIERSRSRRRPERSPHAAQRAPKRPGGSSGDNSRQPVRT